MSLTPDWQLFIVWQSYLGSGASLLIMGLDSLRRTIIGQSHKIEHILKALDLVFYS